MIDRATVDRIFAAADVVEVINDFVTLRKKGVNYQACCPFHNEKTPSFVVSPAKGLFKCFGCGKGGNAVTFVMEHEGMSYPEALKYVAKKYGIEVEEREETEEEKQRNDDRESMLIVAGWASEYFQKQLRETTEGKSVGLSYFRQRGFTDATIKKFELGFCPAAGDAMTKTALGEGYKEAFLTGTGLTIIREQGGYYDRFTGRVMFPIHSISGRAVGFGGRTMRTDKNVAKYLNSPESEIYHKSNLLYGLYHAKKAISQEEYCILVEGYTDVLSMHQAGVENVVASSGTALTQEQIRLIGRFTKNITVIFDGDDAGIRASMRGIDMILREGLNVRVVLLPDGDDPDTFARKHDSAALKEKIRELEEDFMSFKTRLLLKDSKGDPLKKAAVVSDIVTSISQIPDSITRSVFIAECARLMEMDEKVLVSEVARVRTTHGATEETKQFFRNQQAQLRHAEQITSAEGIAIGGTIEVLEQELVQYLLKYGNRSFELREGKQMVAFSVAKVIIGDLESNEIRFVSPVYGAIYELFKELYAESALAGQSFEIEIHNFINHANTEVANVAVDILTSDENYVISAMWKKHEVVTENEEDRLPIAIPKVLNLYKSKAIDGIIMQLNARLADENLPEEDQRDVIFKILALNEEKTLISRKIDRVVL